MKHQPKRPPRRRRHVAMRDPGGRDDHRERPRADGGIEPSDRSGSPPRGPRLGRGSASRHRRAPGPEPPVSHHRRRSHDLNGDRVRNPSPNSSRRGAEPEDLIPRYRESKSRNQEPSHSRSSRRDDSLDRGRPSSSLSTKRRRSRSHTPGSSHRKRSKREGLSSRHGRDRSVEAESSKRRRDSRHDYDEPSHHSGHSRRSAAHHGHVHPHSRRRSRSRSPAPSDSGSRRGARNRDVLRPERSRHGSLDRSPPPRDDHHRHTHQPHKSSRRSHLGEFSDGPSTTTPDFDESRSSRRHPRDLSPHSQRYRSSRDVSEERHLSSRSEVDDDMASRETYRGGFKSLYPHKSHHSDRGYSQSPQHGSSYHNSPSHPPYGQSRGSWSGQYSPQSQHPSHHQGNSNGYGGPSAPTNHQPSSPSFGTSGGASQFSQGYSRTGSRGGFRGSSSGRVGHGAAFKPTHRIGGNNSDATRPSSDEGNSRRQSVGSAANEVEERPDIMDLDETPSREPMDPRPADAHPGETPEAREMAPPSRPRDPETSTQTNTSPKFSFAFKASKPTPTAPKREISQKFNAAPRRKEPPLKENQGREPPKSAPTEPASARVRTEPKPIPDGPRIAPRMRKVTKIMRRPKERPTLVPEQAASDSVFYRKPGDESVVGSGTYGKVFKGLNVYTKGLVALKRIRMEGERDGFPVTAVREIKLLQSLRHTNIVNLQEVMVEKNNCFMVFEYLSHDLTGLLNHPSFKLNPPQRKHLAMQLFQGLDYLHTRGVLHRDIKAANILVSSDGILKLADFGLARFYAKRHQLDYTNRVITIWYRSPELLLGETKYTPAVDVWSAACVMVEIFSRTAIFAGDGTELSQLDKIYGILGTPNRQEWPGLVDMAWFELLRPTARRKSVFAEKYKDKVSPAAFELLSRMFCYDPAKRPSAAEVLQDAYFTTEDPLPKQAVELASIDGDWHEFESKALRKENERRDREARKAAAKEESREKERKRQNDGSEHQRDAKRVHVGDGLAPTVQEAEQGSE